MVDQYKRTYNVIPASASVERATEIFLYGWNLSKQTAGNSYDDAGNFAEGTLSENNAVLWDIPDNLRQTYEDWYAVRYPFTTVSFKPDTSAEFDFAVYPVATATRQINQHFGDNPEWYERFGLPGHGGVDLYALNNSSIYAVQDAIVYEVSMNPEDNYGIHIRLHHHAGDDTYETLYAHLNSVTVSEGMVIAAGDTIGKAGSTGNSTGVHLHLSFKHFGHTYTDEHGVWPYNIHNPEPYLAKFFSTAPSSTPSIGLHLRADPTELSQGEWDEVSTLKSINKPSAVKVLHNHPQNVVSQANGILGSAGTYVIRVFQTFTDQNGQRIISPQDFINWNHHELADRISRCSGDVWVEIHNEPNLVQEGLTGTWQDGAQFSSWATDVVNGFKSLGGVFTTVKYIYPGLSPGSDIDGVRQSSTTFINQSNLSAFDGIGVHAYWSDGWAMQTAIDHVRTYERYGKPILITEVSRNDRPATKTPEQYGEDYARFITDVSRLSHIEAVLFYVGSASDQTFEPETWVTETGQRKGIADSVKNNL